MSVARSRSDETLRIPVDRVPATLILHDGQRAEVEMFVRFGEELEDYLGEGARFIPVRRERRVRLIARAAIACIGVAPRTRTHADALPFEEQSAVVQLLSGVQLEGRLEWIAAIGRPRTVDYLNEGTPYITMQTPDTTYFIAKSQIASVEER